MLFISMKYLHKLQYHLYINYSYIHHMILSIRNLLHNIYKLIHLSLEKIGIQHKLLYRSLIRCIYIRC